MTESRFQSASDIWKRQSIRSQSMPVESRHTTINNNNNNSQTSDYNNSSGSGNSKSTRMPLTSKNDNHQYHNGHNSNSKGKGSSSGMNISQSGGALGRFVRDLLYGSSNETSATTAHSHQLVQVVSRSPPNTQHSVTRSLSTSISEPVQMVKPSQSTNIDTLSPDVAPLSASPTSISPISPISPPPPQASSSSSVTSQPSTSHNFPYFSLRRGKQRKSTSSFVLAASPVEEHGEYNWTTVSPTTRFSRGGQVTFTHVDEVHNRRKHASTVSLPALPDVIRRDNEFHANIDEDADEDEAAREKEEKETSDRVDTTNNNKSNNSWWSKHKSATSLRNNSYDVVDPTTTTITSSDTANVNTYRDAHYAKARHSISVFPRSSMTLDTFRDPYQPHSPMRTGNGNGNSTDSMSPPPPPPRVELVGRYADCPRVLCSDIASQLRLKLPPLQRLSRRWSLLYSLDQHGISFATMLRRVANKGPIILVIQDEEDQIFGGYATESFKPHIGSYGSGECFLWKLHKDTPNDKGQLIVYPWSGKNDYSIMTETDYLAMGADNGKFGIWLDSNFDNGSSMPCATFDNPTLSTHESFTCAHLEIWALQ